MKLKARPFYGPKINSLSEWCDSLAQDIEAEAAKDPSTLIRLTIAALSDPLCVGSRAVLDEIEARRRLARVSGAG